MSKRRKYLTRPSITGAAFPGFGCAPVGNLINPNVTSNPSPGLVFAGPGRLKNIHVQLIFWGAFWNGNPLAQQVTDAATNLLAGPYMTYLAQYGIHRANVRGTSFFDDSEPGSFSTDDVATFLAIRLYEERLPEPDEDPPIVYAVIMPVNSSAKENLNGANSSITWVDIDFPLPDIEPGYFFWAGNNGSLDFITAVFSHELVEIATDPNGGDGVRKVGCTGLECQIADPSACTSWCDTVSGVKAVAYWSQLDGNAALPKMYSIRRTLAGRSIGGKYLVPPQA